MWDTFFSEGSKVLFRYALSIFGMFEEELMNFNDAGPVFDFFRHIPKTRWDMARVSLVDYVIPGTTSEQYGKTTLFHRIPKRAPKMLF